MHSAEGAAVGLRKPSPFFTENLPFSHANLATIAQMDDCKHLQRSFIGSTLAAWLGPRVAKRELEMYGPLSDLSVLELKKLLINAATHVRRQDLEELFAALHKGIGPIALNYEERRAICSKAQFDDLKAEQLALLLKPWRGDATLPISRALFPLGVLNDMAEWVQNCQMLEAFEDIRGFCVDSGRDLFDPEMKRRKSQLTGYEYLSRGVAPHLPDPQTRIPEAIIGTIVPVLNSEWETTYFEIKGVMSEKDLALYVLVPLTTGQLALNENYPVIALFRDLAPKSRELTSWEVDARAALFDTAQDKIQNCLAACLPRDTPCAVTSLGYSNASIDAQLLAALLVRERNDRWVLTGNEQSESRVVTADSTFQNVKKLTLCAWDPEVISSKRDERYSKDRAGLEKTALKIEKHFVFFAKPFAPTYHGTWLGYQDPDTHVVKISLIDFQTTYGRSPDPKACMAFTEVAIDVEMIDRERRIQLLRAQKGYTWPLWKGPTAISRTFFKTILPNLISVQNEVSKGSA